MIPRATTSAGIFEKNCGLQDSLPACRWINRSKFGHCQATATYHEEADDNAIYKCDGATLGDRQCQGSSDTRPAIADVPAHADDVDWPNISLRLLSEAESFKLHCPQCALIMTMVWEEV